MTTYIDAAIVKYWDLVSQIGVDVIRNDALLLMHQDIGQGYKRLKNNRGQPCDKSRGWHGLRGACKRAKKGEDLTAIGKSSRLELAAKIKKEKIAKRGLNEIAGRNELGGSGTNGSDRVDGAKRIKTSRSDITKTADLEKVPEIHRKHLSEAQKIGVALAIDAMDSHGGFLLADGTGVGKTRQMLLIADNYAQQGKKVLIISKAEVLKPDWKKGKSSGSFANDGEAMGITTTLTKDGDLTPGKIHLSTYQNLAKLKGAIDKDTVILYDEAHSMKNYDSAQAKHGIEMSDAAGKVLFATATPADKPLQLGYLSRAGVFAGNTRSDINKWMGLRLVDQHVGGGRTIKKWEIDPKVGAEEVHHRMSGLFDEMTEKGLMVKREISMEGIPVDFKKVSLPQEAYEQQAAIAKKYNDAGGLEKAQMLMHQRRQLEPYKIPAAVDAVKEQIKRGRQAVVFVSRVNESEVGDEDGKVASSEGTAKSLRKALESAGVTEISELHGGSSTKAPKAMEEFQSGKSKVIIATVEAGGTGVNLDDTDGDKPRTLIMMTPPFSAVDNVQAAGRVWRMSTKSTPEIQYLTTDTNVDQWNNEIIANKMQALNASVKGEIGVLSAGSKPSDKSTPAPRPPKPKPQLPKGTIVNKYGGYTKDNVYVPAGEGYTRNINGRWVVFTKESIFKSDSLRQASAAKALRRLAA